MPEAHFCQWSPVTQREPTGTNELPRILRCWPTPVVTSFSDKVILKMVRTPQFQLRQHVAKAGIGERARGGQCRGEDHRFIEQLERCSLPKILSDTVTYSCTGCAPCTWNTWGDTRPRDG